MTDENKYIELEQQEEKPQKTNSLLKDIVSFILVLFICLGLVGIIYHPSYFSGRPSTDQEDLIGSLFNSLQSAAAIYVAQQSVPPVNFSDFVVSKGPALDAKTLTLENIEATVEGLETKTMKLSFDDESVAIYKLDGTDVQVTFSSEWPTKEEIEKDNLIRQKIELQNQLDLERTFVFVFIAVIGMFILIRFIFKQTIPMRPLIYLAVICCIFGSCAN